MSIFRVEPRDPLVVRDGRVNDGRSESRGLDFPPPSVLAGVVRTGLGRRGQRFDASLIEDLLRGVTLRGPMLAGEGLYPPAPADALITHSDQAGYRVQALRPIPTDGSLTSHPGRLVGLLPREVLKTKPARGTPRFWSWGSFVAWLRDPSTREKEHARALLESGLLGLVDEPRMHVAIGDTGTAEDGKLFGTTGTRAAARRWRDTHTDEDDSKPPRYEELYADVHMEVDVLVEPGLVLPGSLHGLRPMAGERRLTHWEEDKKATWPEVPSWLVDHVRGSEEPLVRLVLLTPAYVESSLEPPCLASDGAEFVAARVDRPMTISGWDFAKRAPKQTRRLAPAGSVYWLRLTGDADAREAWVRSHWFETIGDCEKLRRDGFGLAALGIGTEVAS